MKRKFVEPYIRYGMCHEDPLTLLRALPGRTVKALSIGSGGDNSLALLTGNVAEVTVFDRNPAQIYLCKLKATAAERLSYADMLVLAGAARGDVKAVFAALQGALEPEVRDYFLAREDELARFGVLGLGKFEHYIRIFTRRILPLCWRRRTLRSFALADDVATQRDIYARRIDNRRWRFFARLFFSELAVSHLGRDKSFFKYADGKDLAAQIVGRLECVFARVPNAVNPFVNYSTLGDLSVLPFWLQEDNFAAVKRNVGKLRFLVGDLDTVASMGETYDFFNLSDIFEYMDETATDEAAATLAAMADPGATVVFWNMLVDRDFKNDNFVYDALADKLYAEEMTFYYKKLCVYRKTDHDIR